MRSALLSDRPGERVHLLVFEAGDEAMALLKAFCAERRVASGHLSGIGALAGARVAFFEPDAKQYEEIEVDEQVEVLALLGNVAWRDDEPLVHAHIVLGRRDGSARGGHLLEARVRPTLEVALSESAEPVRRRLDARVGLPLIKLDG
jgi:predicted DNA-binding protein with PD1-like motif